MNEMAGTPSPWKNPGTGGGLFFKNGPVLSLVEKPPGVVQTKVGSIWGRKIFQRGEANVKNGARTARPFKGHLPETPGFCPAPFPKGFAPPRAKWEKAPSPGPMKWGPRE